MFIDIYIFYWFWVFAYRYYKAHLFGEASEFDSVPPVMNNINTAYFDMFWSNSPNITTIPVTTKTRIGVFTCFDLEFNWPARWLASPPFNIRTFVMSRCIFVSQKTHDVYY